jgi:YHS domain-containing protein
MSALNLGNKLAIKGFDPVSYFSGNAKSGDPAISSEHESSVYYFSNEENKNKFEGSPNSFIPAYGGFCATAMSEGKLFDIDPNNFKVDNNKLFLFYKGSGGDTKLQWEEDEATRFKNAEEHWANGKYE